MSRRENPRVLCISPFFAPLANAEAFTGGKAALGLLDAGVDLTAYTVDYTAHPKFSRDASPLWSPLERHTRAIPPHGHRSKLFSSGLGLRYATLEWSRWISAVVADARTQHRASPFDIVYSRSLPNFAHVAAYWISRAIKRPWIANFNDPSDLEATGLLPHERAKRKQTLGLRVSDFWLKRVLRTADVVTFPCSRLRDYHLRIAQPRGKSVVVPHVGCRADPSASSDLFRIMHAGSLGSGETTRRNTTISLLRGLRGFIDHRPDAEALCRLVLVGPEDRPTLSLATELNLGPYVSCTGRVSYSESLRHIASATVCLLIEGKMTEGVFLPSKFPDYVMAKRPVIALSPTIGTIGDLVPSRGVTVVEVDNPAAIEAALIQHFDAFTNGKIADFEPGTELQQKYDIRQVGLDLRALCQALMTQAR